jgi:hypothetical protein
MSLCLRWWLPLVALLAVPAAAAADGAEARARAALALAVSTHRPAAQRQGPVSAPADGYARLRARAVAEGRVLLVWVGFARPDLESALPDRLHYRCPAFPGAAPPCVVVGRPAGGELWRAADLPADAADALRPGAAPPRACGPGG